MITPSFWRERRVLLTGHTGFKGAWTALVLQRLGAQVTGFAHAAGDSNDLFVLARVADGMDHRVGDVRDLDQLARTIDDTGSEIVLHMAAQSLVGLSYVEPALTYATNVMGTVHVLEAARRAQGVRAVVVVTSDKCYENLGTQSHRESDRLGGHDPYSSSKACAELVTSAYRDSFLADGQCKVASVRAGNVIGGGDWARDRLVPDVMRAFLAGKPARIRRPGAVRPWQHVLDPVMAYLGLAQRLVERGDVAEAWNFGPGPAGEQSVGDIVEELASRWSAGARWESDPEPGFLEAELLSLDCSKAADRLGWHPLFDLPTALDMTVSWYQTFQRKQDVRALALDQISAALAKLVRAPAAGRPVETTQ